MGGCCSTPYEDREPQGISYRISDPQSYYESIRHHFVSSPRRRSYSTGVGTPTRNRGSDGQWSPRSQRHSGGRSSRSHRHSGGQSSRAHRSSGGQSSRSLPQSGGQSSRDHRKSGRESTGKSHRRSGGKRSSRSHRHADGAVDDSTEDAPTDQGSPRRRRRRKGKSRRQDEEQAVPPEAPETPEETSRPPPVSVEDDDRGDHDGRVEVTSPSEDGVSEQAVEERAVASRHGKDPSHLHPPESGDEVSVSNPGTAWTLEPSE